MAKTRSRKYQEQKTWQAFSKYVRTRDCLNSTGNPNEGVCFTCGARLSYSKLQAGHIVSRTWGKAMYNPNVVFSQCTYCNHTREGAHVMGFFKLMEKYGLDKATEICMDAMGNHPYSIDELVNIEIKCLAWVERKRDEWAVNNK